MSYLITLILAITGLLFTLHLYKQRMQTAPVRQELARARANNRLKGMHDLRTGK